MTSITILVLLKFSVVLAVPYRVRLPMYHTSYSDYSSSQSTGYASSRFYSSEYNPGQNQIPGSSGADYSDCCADDNNYVGQRQRPGGDSGQDYPIQPQPEPSPSKPSAREKTITGNGEGDYEEEIPVQDSRPGSSEGDHDERRHSGEKPEEKEKDKPKVHTTASPEKKDPEDPKEEEDDDDYKPQSDDDLIPRTPSDSFSRPCSSYFDCDFAPPFTNNTSKEYFQSTWFTCNGKYCMCELFGVVQFTPFRVSWSKSSNQCLSDIGGPCGRHDGLEIHCATGYHCIDGTCDDREKSTTEKPSSTTPACGCEGGKDCEDDQVNPFSVLFFPKNIFETVLNATIKEITESKSPDE